MNYTLLLRCGQVVSVLLGAYLVELVHQGVAVSPYLMALLPALALLTGQAGHYAPSPKK